MEKIDYNLLDYDHEKRINTYKGEPFSGIVYEYDSQNNLTEIMMIAGKEHGTMREWYLSHQLKKEMHLFNGVAHGIWWEWHDNGVLKKEGVYEFGIKLRETLWKRDGTLDSEYIINEKYSTYQRNIFRSKS